MFLKSAFVFFSCGSITTEVSASSMISDDNDSALLLSVVFGRGFCPAGGALCIERGTSDTCVLALPRLYEYTKYVAHKI